MLYEQRTDQQCLIMDITEGFCDVGPTGGTASDGSHNRTNWL